MHSSCQRTPLPCSILSCWPFEAAQTVFLLPYPPCRSEELADWRQLRSKCGADWLLAAPLACAPSRQHSTRLLGAVLVAGRGGQPCVDERWLEEWAGEMASNIYHASVQLMEVGGHWAGRIVGRGVGGWAPLVLLGCILDIGQEGSKH